MPFYTPLFGGDFLGMQGLGRVKKRARKGDWAVQPRCGALSLSTPKKPRFSVEKRHPPGAPHGSDRTARGPAVALGRSPRAGSEQQQAPGVGRHEHPKQGIRDSGRVRGSRTAHLPALTWCRKSASSRLKASGSSRFTACPLHGSTASTGGSAPFVVVNGPIARAIGMNATHNVLGNASRANATIGRAVRLVMRNVIGTLPGEKGYNDLRQVWKVTVPKDYVANTLVDAGGLQQAGYKTEQTQTLRNMPIVPDKSKAKMRLKGENPELQRAWYQGEVANFFSGKSIAVPSRVRAQRILCQNYPHNIWKRKSRCSAH